MKEKGRGGWIWPGTAMGLQAWQSFGEPSKKHQSDDCPLEESCTWHPRESITGIKCEVDPDDAELVGKLNAVLLRE